MAAVPEVDLKVFYGCDWGARPYRDPGFGTTFSWDIDLLAGYEAEFLTSRRQPERFSFWELDNPDIIARLEDFRPHVLYLHGYNHRSCWRASAWGRGQCARLHFGDSELVSPRGRLKRALKAMVLRAYFRRFDAFISIGDNNERYYRHYGVPEHKLFRGAYPIDLRRFRESLSRPGRPSRADVRQRFGIPPDVFVALQVGKLQPSKRPLDLVRALTETTFEVGRVYALFVGDGPLRTVIEAEAQRLGLGNRVVVTGFINQSELPIILDAGDVLVTASESDPHPLVVSESMAVGLPIVASDRVGCIGPSDSARPDVNTLVFRCGNIADLARQLGRVVTDDPLRRRLAKASAELAPTQDVSVTLRAVLRAALAQRDKFKFDWSEVPADELWARCAGERA